MTPGGRRQADAPGPSPAGRRSGHGWRIFAAGLVLALAAIHWVAIGRENIHRDEFSLLERAQRSLASGKLHGGGRPGLGVLTLMPLVSECDDEIATVRNARRAQWVWTVVLLLGFVALLRATLPDRVGADRLATLALALYAVSPTFLRWSLQVRTDGPAVAASLWGGVCLLASRRRLGWSVAAGALFAVGFLFSQKAVYAAALAGLLALGEPLLRGSRIELRREAARAVLCLGTAAAGVVLFRLLLGRWYLLAPIVQVSGELATFDFYRNVVRWNAFPEMLPTLVPHVLLLLLVVAALPGSFRRHPEERAGIVLAVAALGLGLAVYLFHAGRFPYFWMTLGLFPATALALGLGATASELGERRVKLVTLGCVAILIAQALPAAVALTADTQAAQRSTLAFVDRNFGRPTHGFQAEGALFCRDDAEPLPVFMGVHLHRAFAGPDRDRRVADFLACLRARPPAFLVDTFRLEQFPEEIRAFWDRHYRLYAERVRIPTVEVEETATTLEVLLAGRYRWRPASRRAESRLVVAGRLVGRGETVDLPAGEVEVSFPGDPAAGTLWWAIDDPPTPPGAPFFLPE